MRKRISTKELVLRLSACGESKMSEDLEKRGWNKRTTIGEPRLTEIVELYKSLGYEVRVEPVKLDELDDDCKKCYADEAEEVKTVYVKKREGRTASDILTDSD